MNRRRFLTRGFALGAGGIFVPRILRAQLSDPAFVASMTQQPTAPSFVYYAAAFDGSTNYARRTSAVTVSSTKTGLVSFWVKMHASSSDTAEYYFTYTLQATGNLFYVRRSTDTKLMIRGCKSDGTAILIATTSAIFTAGSGWKHVIASWNLATTTVHIYVDGSSNCAVGTATNDTISYADNTAWSVAASSNGTGKLYGSLAEVWFNTEYLDISVEANREKFRSGGHPVNLGTDGSTPTGTQPVLYFHDQVPNWETNLGSGGAFTEVGTIADDSSLP